MGIGLLAACDPRADDARVVVPAGSAWRYADAPAAGWREPGFDDTDWAGGPAPLGFGRVGVRTRLPDALGRDDDERSTALRHVFELVDASAVARVRLRLVRDDGAVVFLNGREIARSNVLHAPLDAELPAATPTSPSDDQRELWLEPDALRSGKNVLAVDLRGHWRERGALFFDLELALLPADAPLRLLRAPYVQRLAPTSAVVLWGTNRPVAGEVRYGASRDALERSAVSVPGSSHEVVLQGLEPGSTVHYAVLADGEVLEGGGPFAFRVPPVSGTRDPFRIWVLGDSGTADWRPRAVRDGYLRFSEGRLPDVWLMLGDNAYPTGSEPEYQRAVFEMYPELLRQTALWPVVGNHDAKSSDTRRQRGPFFQAFALPAAGEAGGVASGSEAYYSFDHGNVHFVALDTEGSKRKKMVAWLKRDLAATDADWIVAYWHRPIYSRGTSADDAADARQHPFQDQVLPLLEEAGVDLVLAGHSHGYERSRLLGATGGDPARARAGALDPGDGDPEGDGVYVKRGREGAVFVVAGSSGQIGDAPLDHPAMAVSLRELGSLVLDVDGCTLDGRFVNLRGWLRDHFRITKPGCAEDVAQPSP